MNPRILFAALRARYRVMLLILGVTFLVTALVSVLLPKTYVATVAVLVDGKDDQSISTNGSIPVRERAGYMQTQVDIITSQKVAHKVIQELGLAMHPKVRRAFEKDTGGTGSIENWMVDILLKQLKLDTSQSSVIHIAFSSADAEQAAQIANAFARAYMATALELRVEPSRQTALWFDEQIKGLRDNLEKAQTRLTDYQKEKGILALDERFDVENIALSSLSTQYAKAQEQAYITKNRRQENRALPVTFEAGDKLPGSASNPQIQGLKNDVIRSESKLSELESRFGINHPQYQRQLVEARNLNDRLADEIKHFVGAQGNSVEQNQRRSVELRKALTVQQTRVLELKSYRNMLGSLVRDAEMAQKAYETATERAVVSRVDSRASLTNISVLYSAIPPFKAARPRIGLNLALALVIGLLLGLSVIYMLEMFDHRVRSSSDLDNPFNVPVLAELNTNQPPQHRLIGRTLAGYALPNPG